MFHDRGHGHEEGNQAAKSLSDMWKDIEIVIDLYIIDLRHERFDCVYDNRGIDDTFIPAHFRRFGCVPICNVLCGISAHGIAN